MTYSTYFERGYAAAREATDAMRRLADMCSPLAHEVQHARRTFMRLARNGGKSGHRHRGTRAWTHRYYHR